DEANAMRDRPVLLIIVTRRYLPCPLAQFIEAHTGSKNLYVMTDLLDGERIESALLLGRPAGTAIKRPADVGAITDRPDEIGVEADEIASLDNAIRAFLKPRIGPGARCQKARLDPLAAERNVGVMQFGPELILGDAGTQHMAHPRHPRIGGRDGAFDAGNLRRGLDRARLLADGLTV